MKAYSSYTIIDVIDGLQWQGDLDAAPENPKEGWAYYNTQTKMSYIYDGEKWVVFARDGEQGVPGTPGANGKTTYFHIKYSEKADGNPMTETPSVYIGTYVDYEIEDSTDYTKYTWSRFQGLQGETGEQGIPGSNGVDGKTSYLHIKYSNDGGTTFTANNGETAGDYIGQYVDFTQTDSTDPTKYIWSKIKGEQGNPGQNGSNGLTPEIRDGYWYIGDTNTGIKAEGIDGNNGLTPHIGDNGNWFIGETDTGIKAEGKNGSDGASVSAITEQYHISESNTIAPATDVVWSNEFPMWTGSTGTGENKKSTFVWKRTKTQLTQGSTITYKYSAPVLMNQYDAATMAAQKAGLDIGTWCSNNDVTIIDGSAIATGTLDADRIKANTITSDQIAAKGITAGSLNVTELSTITANMGVLNTGEIRNKNYNADSTEIEKWEGSLSKNSAPTSTDSASGLTDNGLSYGVLNSTLKTAYVIWDHSTAITEVAISPTFTSGGVEYTVTNVYNTGFLNCTSLTKIVFPNTIGQISSQAFEGCTNLKEVIFLENSTLSAIDSSAFSGCSKLATINLPDSLTYIEANAFLGCSLLAAMYIGTSVISIGSGAFSGCSSLASLTLPFVGSKSSATTASSSTLFGYIFGTTSYTGGVATKQEYSSTSSKTYYIPAALKNVTITGGNLYRGAFFGCGNIEKVILGSGVKSVGEYAFYKCTGLKSVSIPDNIDTIGVNAFQGCTGLLSMVFPASLTKIEESAFSGCTALRNLYFPANEIVVEDNVFENLYSNETLEHISTWSEAGKDTKLIYVISSGMTTTYWYYRDDAWQSTKHREIADPLNVYITDIQSWCKSTIHTSSSSTDSLLPNYFLYLNGRELTNLVYPSNISYIPPHSLQGCWSIVSLEIPDTIVEIGKWSFSNCHNLERAVIGNGVTEINEKCFYGCYNLVDVALGRNLLAIRNSAFYLSNIDKTRKKHNFYYLGTKEQWTNRVFLGSTLNQSHQISDIDTNIYFYTDHKQDALRTLEGKYWTYSNDNNFIISCDNGTIKSRYFKLNSDGTLNAENVNIRGAIAATTISSIGIVPDTNDKDHSVVKAVLIEDGELKVQSAVATLTKSNNPTGKIYAGTDINYNTRFIIENVSRNDGYFKGNWQFNGTVKDSGGNLISSSDVNVKNSIQAQPEVYSEIFDRLNPVIYKYNNGSSDRYHTGLIAQEVEQAVIDSGMTTQDFAAVCYETDEDGTKKNYGIRYGELVSMCIYEIQRLKKRVDELEKELQKGAE